MTANGTKRKPAAVAEPEKAAAVEVLPAPEAAKASPIVRPPRVITDVQAAPGPAKDIETYANALLDLTGLEGARARQWLADAIDAANRFQRDFKAAFPKAQLAPQTVLRAVKNGASVELSFSATLKQLYLVPFRNGKLSDGGGPPVYDCQLIVGYQGYEALAYKIGWLDSLYANVVLADEVAQERFVEWHDEKGPHIWHRPVADRRVPRRAIDALKVVAGAYVTWRTARGSFGCAYANYDRIARCLPQQKNGGGVDLSKLSPMWNWDFPSGAKKTAVREAAPNWPKTRQLAGALVLDEQAELGETQTDVSGRRIAEFEPDVPAAVIDGPRLGDVAGLGDDDADDAPLFRTLVERVERLTGGPNACRDAIHEARAIDAIDADQHRRLLRQLEERAVSPDPEVDVPDDEIPF